MTIAEPELLGPLPDTRPGACLVTSADVTPYGWVADVCGHRLKPGDRVSATRETHIRHDVPVLGNWVCGQCLADRGTPAAAA